MTSEHRPRVLVLVMAAGFSRRFGITDKRTAILADGRSLLAATLSQLSSPTGASYQLAVVIRPEDDVVALGIPEHLRVLRAPAAADGLGASIADAVRAVADDAAFADVDSLAIMLGDMPAIHADTLTALIDAASRGQIVRPRYRDQPGHPVLFGRDFWGELGGLSGDEGGRTLLKANADCLLYIDLDDGGVVADIDTPEQLAQLSH
ncbi:nucleotidyltransferase family protein [Marinobacterium lutimaris]|uniref:Molybdenum cofactor cytidylyltransferase n=1 Tax=Marinobacterium lutimaris TaxID=568106 RepID=A0A1H6C216_9GAMM|nr:nucleotidyltransferase family protein [Marinobacterium lutimaris]SEG66999.1 molybdenum cofactor cytidylyltransferase [Marinobacterium lutimaris]